MGKFCTKCGEFHEISDYQWVHYRRSTNYPRRESWCKGCAYANTRQWAKKNYTPDVIKAKFVQRKYGIHIDQYNKMLLDQNDTCLICSGSLGDKPHFDHCHETGAWRGFLCFKCNTGLGLFGDSIDLLTAAIEHLRPYK